MDSRMDIQLEIDRTNLLLRYYCIRIAADNEIEIQLHSWNPDVRDFLKKTTFGKAVRKFI